MSAASKSVRYFGYYLVGLSIVLIAFPNTLLGMFGFADTTEHWIRVVGVLVLNIGILYIYMAPANVTLFFTLTVYTRTLVLIWFVLFVLAGWAAAPLILFGVVDLAGAVWTYLALKKASRA
jgi:hypothetical protein